MKLSECSEFQLCCAKQTKGKRGESLVDKTAGAGQPRDKFRRQVGRHNTAVAGNCDNPLTPTVAVSGEQRAALIRYVAHGQLWPPGAAGRCSYMCSILGRVLQAAFRNHSTVELKSNTSVLSR